MRRPRPAVERLEPRRLMSGVTLVTHGYQSSSNQPLWVDTMADALVDRLGVDTAVYALRVNHVQNVPYVEKFEWLTGPAPSGPITANGEAVIMLDWAAASGVFFTYTNAAAIAELIAPYFLASNPGLGLHRPLAESPVHLIGHSRGGSLVSALAKELGEEGIWVDQLTTLDPHPVAPDPIAIPHQNVVFADNYFQDGSLFDLAGSRVDGAYNMDLSSVSGITHTSVHAFYHGTINVAATSDGAGGSISNSWYGTPMSGPRDRVGYAWSRVGGTSQPAAGVGSRFGGQGSRAAVTRAQTQWPNVGGIELQNASATVSIGDALHLSYRHENHGVAATLSWYADSDTNPYNGHAAKLPGVQTLNATQGVVGAGQYVGGTAGVPAGLHHVFARIEGSGGRVRYAYLSEAVVFVQRPGDADGDGRITISDYLRIDRGSARGLTGYANGDFNRDGAIDGADYFIIDQAYLAGLAAGALQPWEAPRAAAGALPFSREPAAALCVETEADHILESAEAVLD